MKDVKKEEKKIDKKKEKRIRFHVIIVFFIIVFGIGIAPKALQNDTFYTVKIGEYISQNGISNLREDPFSWNELPYVFPHWLYDFMMYGIYYIMSNHSDERVKKDVQDSILIDEVQTAPFGLSDDEELLPRPDTDSINLTTGV